MYCHEHFGPPKISVRAGTEIVSPRTKFCRKYWSALEKNGPNAVDSQAVTVQANSAGSRVYHMHNS